MARRRRRQIGSKRRGDGRTAVAPRERTRYLTLIIKLCIFVVNKSRTMANAGIWQIVKLVFGMLMLHHYNSRAVGMSENPLGSSSVVGK